MADFIGGFRSWRGRFKAHLPVNPDHISALSVLVSFGVFAHPMLAVIGALALDALDGMVARAGKMDGGVRGKIADRACDRYSEFVIFGYYAARNPVLVVLPVLNTALTLRDGQAKTAWTTLPLRQLLLAYLIFA